MTLKYAGIGENLHVALPPLTAAWDMRRGFKGDVAPRAKWSLTLMVPAGEAFTPLRTTLRGVDARALNHVVDSSEEIFGNGGVGLRFDKVNIMRQAAAAGALPFYRLLREDGGRFSIVLKFAVDDEGRPLAHITNEKGAKVPPASVKRGSRCAVLGHLKGLYVAENMMSVQFEADAMQVLSSLRATDAEFDDDRLYASAAMFGFHPQ